MQALRRPEKVLGVLGGMGPAATAEFLRLLAERAPAARDQEHGIVYVLSDPQIPDRSSAILGEGEDPTDRLRRGLMALADWGADLLAVPCNTAHYFIDRFRDELPVPLVHIVEETVREAGEIGPRGSWLLSTLGTMQSGLFQSEAERSGYSLLAPPKEDQLAVQRCIQLVKEGRTGDAGVILKEVVERLWNERDIPVCVACTELPLAYEASGLPAERAVSSLKALCDACLRSVYDQGSIS
ncbi:MAG: aspartate/glutamate racemase family protein [Synergistaceae bacterium]|nr:amino acid racemase [Synergistota bacterium]NLM71595.1 aspartate/glutamate racemase family protein [Synergistaceae bacterium]